MFEKLSVAILEGIIIAIIVGGILWFLSVLGLIALNLFTTQGWIIFVPIIIFIGLVIYLYKKNRG